MLKGCFNWKRKDLKQEVDGTPVKGWDTFKKCGGVFCIPCLQYLSKKRKKDDKKSGADSNKTESVPSSHKAGEHDCYKIGNKHFNCHVHCMNEITDDHFWLKKWLETQDQDLSHIPWHCEHCTRLIAHVKDEPGVRKKYAKYKKKEWGRLV